jgi:phosphatidylinositol-4-phosphate 3-kinase
VNFFIHNLAQARFNDEGIPSDNELLSFSSKTYSAKTDGRIKTVSVYGIQVGTMLTNLLKKNKI